MFCSLATNIGYQLGLHRPLHRSDYDESVDVLVVSTAVERKTWYGCFIVSQGYVTVRGGLVAAMVLRPTGRIC